MAEKRFQKTASSNRVKKSPRGAKSKALSTMKNVFALFFCAIFHSTNGVANQHGAFSFALIGDMPYQTGTKAKSDSLSLLQQQVNHDTSISWVIHAGDIKTGNQTCSDEMFENRKAYFDDFLPAFVYTPGDNDWADCHRYSAGGFNPLERLLKLRQIFHRNHNKKMAQATEYFVTQAQLQHEFSQFKENALWRKNGITFATVHIIGSKNGQPPLADFFRFKRKTLLEREIQERNAAALSWLNISFQHAINNRSAGLFITIHANPGLWSLHNARARQPFKDFLQTLDALTTKFPGKVVLAHGDSHTFRVDRPILSNNVAPKNFLRVEAFGENDANWIKIRADRTSPGVFSFMPVLN